MNYNEWRNTHAFRIPQKALEDLDAMMGERVSLTREQMYALREGHQIGAADAYFRVHTTHDNDVGRMLFERGFNRGFEAGQDAKGTT